MLFRTTFVGDETGKMELHGWAGQLCCGESGGGVLVQPPKIGRCLFTRPTGKGTERQGILGRRNSFSQSKGVWNSILIWGTVQGSPCWKQGSPCLEHGWGRERGANTEVRDIGKGADQGQPGGPGCRDPELISLAMESLWKDLVRGVTIKFSF